MKFGPFTGPGAVSPKHPEDQARAIATAEKFPELWASLTRAQRRVFESICIGCDGMHAKRTLDALEEKGLIVGFDVSQGPFVFRRWGVALAVHMAWAMTCEEESDHG